MHRVPKPRLVLLLAYRLAAIKRWLYSDAKQDKKTKGNKRIEICEKNKIVKKTGSGAA